MEGTTSTPTASTSTESTATSTPVSTGTTTGTPSTPTPAERPKTFAEAFAKDAAQTPDPSTPPDGATTLPVEGTDPLSATPPSTEQGPIPFTAHKKTLENVRAQAQPGIDFAKRINDSPTAFFREYTSELLAHPQHGPIVRAELGRMFGGLRQPVAPAQPAATKPPIDLNPDMQVVDNDGRVVGATFSADKVKALLEQTVAPLKQESDQRRTEQAAAMAREQAAQTAAQAKVKADQHFTRVDRILEGDEALYAEVNRLMAEDPSLDAVDAALEVRKQKIAPAAESKAQADVLKHMQTKAAAQAVNPAGAVVAATSRPRSFMDKSLKW